MGATPTLRDKSFTLMELVMVLVIIVILSAIAGNYLTMSRASTADMIAQTKLRQMSTAIESYASDTTGFYPVNMDILHTIDPPYINENYCATTYEGFYYDCSLWTAGYYFSATPINNSISSVSSYSIETGGVLTQN